MRKSVHVLCALFLHGKEVIAVTIKKSSIKDEMTKIVRKRVEPSYLEKFGIVSDTNRKVSILQAIALAQVKKGLEGDLKAAMYIEQLLADENKAEAAEESVYDIVVKVIGESDGA